MGATALPLQERYDLAVLDLDGVVYVGAEAVPGAAPALAAARAAGMSLAYVTNNASRGPQEVAAHLAALGVPAEPADVVTSAQAAARLIASQVDPGSKVYVIGGSGLHLALEERGLAPVTDPGADPVAVVQGYGPDMPWRQVIDGAILVRSGLPWVASNTDATVPTQRGPGPGNGALVDLVARFAGRDPEVAGKPLPPLFEETRERVGGANPLVVGDRLDTDIDGALAVGWDSLLVMTGVSGLREIAAVPRGRRPTHLGADLSALARVPVTAELEGRRCRAGGWTAEIRRARLEVTGAGDRHAWWTAAAGALWAELDRAGVDVDLGGVEPPR